MRQLIHSGNINGRPLMLGQSPIHYNFKYGSADPTSVMFHCKGAAESSLEAVSVATEFSPIFFAHGVEI